MLLKSLIFAGALQGLFLVLLLRAKKPKPLADQWLMAWLILVSIQLFFYLDSLSIKPVATNFCGIIAFSIPLLTAPILFQYILSISSGKAPHLKTVAFYVVPWLIYVILTTATGLTYHNGITVRYGFPHFTAIVPKLLIYLFTMPIAVIPGLYALKGLLVLNRYRKSLPDKYSYTEKINLNWLKWLVISILGLFVLLFLFIRFGRQQQLAGTENLFAYVGATLALYVFFIGYMGLQQQSAIEKDSNTAKLEQPAAYQKTGLDEISSAQLYSSLLNYMEEEKPYLNDELNLAMLAQQIGINANQLSQIINQQSTKNFFVFVNGYRVEAVKVKLLDPQFSHLSILGIAYESGFRSKSAFNRIFKTQTGLTPLEYQKQNNLGTSPAL
ncbi:AraC family transcriptional regulator [Pedobacter miscanthi]|jgi:AraC-like DNA-binding protein|uniref:helix-turn-helix domain-containing protein n=1 Tax=Pedobacter miscanthi TaxID=2259170 RepID=UPI00292FFE5C|nr:AraC family transcriptional regulator [Pedobacter miscanthi]